jgi:aminoglycoside/choline kinase family phosphotransferase
MLAEPALSDVLTRFVKSFTGGERAAVETLVGDASSRRYHRVSVAGGSPASSVVMELPDDPLKSDEGTSQGPPPELPFLNVQRYLADGGLPVPRVYRHDVSLGLIALEDLGDRTFEMAVKEDSPAHRQSRYRQAMAHIVAIQRLGRERPDDRCVAFGRRFDRDLLRWELDHFREWYLEADAGVSLSAPESQVVGDVFDWIATTLAGSPPVLVHRDFQSRNLMLVEDAGRPSIRIIDFQDALLGSQAYDLVALLRDSYVELPPAEVDAHVAWFSEQIGRPADEFRRLFVVQALQRKLKDTGRFIYIDRVRKNPNFLRWVPTSLRYVAAALKEAPREVQPLREILEQRLPGLRV